MGLSLIQINTIFLVKESFEIIDNNDEGINAKIKVKNNVTLLSDVEILYVVKRATNSHIASYNKKAPIDLLNGDVIFVKFQIINIYKRLHTEVKFPNAFNALPLQIDPISDLNS